MNIMINKVSNRNPLWSGKVSLLGIAMDVPQNTIFLQCTMSARDSGGVNFKRFHFLKENWHECQQKRKCNFCRFNTRGVQVKNL